MAIRLIRQVIAIVAIINISHLTVSAKDRIVYVRDLLEHYYESMGNIGDIYTFSVKSNDGRKIVFIGDGRHESSHGILDWTIYFQTRREGVFALNLDLGIQLGARGTFYGSVRELKGQLAFITIEKTGSTSDGPSYNIRAERIDDLTVKDINIAESVSEKSLATDYQRYVDSDGVPRFNISIKTHTLSQLKEMFPQRRLDNVIDASNVSSSSNNN